jgi:hypothetical protein
MAELKLMNPSIYAAEDEVDEWREKIYTETKGMTPDEFNEYVHRKTEPLVREYKMRVVQTGMNATK